MKKREAHNFHILISITIQFQLKNFPMKIIMTMAHGKYELRGKRQK